MVTSPTPKVLTEADLAGLPRAVSEPPLPKQKTKTVIVGGYAVEVSGYTAEHLTAYAAEYCAAVVSERDALAGRVAELEAALKPNLFWNDADPEHGETSIFEVIDSEWNGGCMKHGDEMVIQQAVRLPNIRVRLIPCPTDGDDYFDYEVIDAALSATTPESKP